MSAETKLLAEILERVNRDQELVYQINSRKDLGYPDLHVALVLAQRIDEGEGQDA